MKPILVIILAIFSIQANSQADRKYIRKGNSEFEDGQFQQSEIEYRKALEKVPQSYRADYNLGNALYKQKQYDAAATKYATLAEKENDRQNLNRYFYNLGNALYENRKYQESVEAYKKALRNNPGDMDAKQNLQLALKMLQSKNQQQNQKNQDQKDKDQQNQSQQNNTQNKNQQQQNQQQEQNDKNEQQAKQQQNPKGQISPGDAERILQALENDEKNLMKKIQEQKEHVEKVPLEKNW